MAGFVADAELGFASDHDQQLFVIGLAVPNLYAGQGSRDEPGEDGSIAHVRSSLAMA